VPRTVAASIPRAAALVAATLVALVCTGCGESEEPTFGEDDRSVAVETGERFRVELAANPGVGDDWNLAKGPDPAVARLLEEGFESDAGDDVVGAPGVEYFVFEAVAPGMTEIVLRYCYRGCGSAEGESLERLVALDVAVS